MWPILYEGHGFILYSYPLFLGLSWGLGFRLAEAQLPAGLPRRHFVWWMVGMFLSSWVGAKLLFIMTQNRWETAQLVSAASFWLGGGFVFLGGFLGALLFSGLVGLTCPTLKPQRLQFTIVPLLWGHALGRVGCFLAGCCYGDVSELPWAIKMHEAHRHPVQLYEALGLALLAWWLGHRAQERRFLVFYLLGYGSLRWLVELFRGDEVRGLWLGQSTSQLLSLGLLAAGLLLAWRLKLLEIRS